MKGDFSDSLETPTLDLDSDRPKKTYVGPDEVHRHGQFFAGLTVAVIGLLAVTVWCLGGDTSVDAAKASASACELSELGLFMLVVLMGAVGSLVHAVGSFATFAGNRQLVHSWLWWLYMRVPIGVLIAILVYAGIRADVFGKQELSSCKDLFYIAFLCGLSGLFSKQVADKLKDIVDNLFVPAKPPERTDALKPTSNDGTPTDSSGGTGPAAVTQPDETIQKVQQLLIELGHLRPTSADGRPSADGVLGDTTRKAIDEFFEAEGVVPEERAVTFGAETSPDFWPNLQRVLAKTIEARKAGAAGGEDPSEPT